MWEMDSGPKLSTAAVLLQRGDCGEEEEKVDRVRETLHLLLKREERHVSSCSTNRKT